ncbi:MAG: NADH-quinone oxidoreductase subunit L [Nitrososphaerota archaeon]
MNLAAWLLWILPLISSPLVVLISKIGRRAVELFACIVSFIAFVLSLMAAVTYIFPSIEKITNWLPIMDLFLEIKIDGISVLLTVFISFLSFLITLYSVGYISHEEAYTRYYSLILLFIGSMLGLVMAGNLVQLYFFWELVGICSAFLIAYYNYRETARRAGFKAFLVTRIGDAAFLFAILLTYAITGTTSLDAAISSLQNISRVNEIVGIISLLFLIGAMAKSAQVPLHVWLPDAMEGPTPVSALIHAATMVNAGVYLLVRITPVISELPSLLVLTQIVGLASLLLGALCSLVSTDIKRVLAYSTISQIGLMFYSIGLGFWHGAIFHLISQGIFKALGFLAAGSILTVVGTGNIDELGGLRKYMKYTYLSFLFAVITMSGFPPFIGFWSKDAILYTTIEKNVGLALIIGLSSLLTTLYGFRLIFRVFYGDAKISRPQNDAPAIMLIPMTVLVFLTFVSWPLLLTQRFVDFSFSLHIDLTTLSLTLIVLLSGLGLTFFIINKYKTIFDKLVSESNFLIKIRAFLMAGFGFDIIYSRTINKIMPSITKLIRRTQTGMLNINMIYVLVTVIIIIIIFIGGAA